MLLNVSFSIITTAKPRQVLSSAKVMLVKIVLGYR